jgi:LmbE family N-acetylglucosaminyl deacetylase
MQQRRTEQHTSEASGRRRPAARALFRLGVIAAALLGIVSGVIALRIQAANSFQSTGPLPASLRLPGEMRLLVISPHPDDETLGCGGLIARVRGSGGQVRVVFLTNGDAFKVAASREERKIRPTPQDLIDFGAERQREAMLAGMRLGLKPSDLLFLGFPDRGLTRLWTGNWAVPFTSGYTGVSHCPYRLASRPGALYTGQELLRILSEVISEWRPTLICVPGPLDDHPDHYAAYAFTTAAVSDLEMRGRFPEGRPRLMTYLIHRGQWPAPRGPAPSRPLAPPQPLMTVGTHWEVFPLRPHEISAKQAAIGEYRSQTAVMGSFLRSFVRSSELYGREPVRAVAAVPDGLVGLNGRTAAWETIEAQAPSPEADTVGRALRRGADITGLSVARDSHNVYLRMQTAGSRGKGVSARLQVRSLGPDGFRGVEVTVSATGKVQPPGIQATWRGQALEVAIPAGRLGDASLIWVGASTHYLGFTVDKTGWHRLEMPGRVITARKTTPRVPARLPAG